MGAIKSDREEETIQGRWGHLGRDPNNQGAPERPKKGLWSEGTAYVKALEQELMLHKSKKSEQGAGKEEVGSHPDGTDATELDFYRVGHGMLLLHSICAPEVKTINPVNQFNHTAFWDKHWTESQEIADWSGLATHLLWDLRQVS